MQNWGLCKTRKKNPQALEIMVREGTEGLSTKRGDGRGGQRD